MIAPSKREDEVKFGIPPEIQIEDPKKPTVHEAKQKKSKTMREMTAPNEIFEAPRMSIATDQQRPQTVVN